MPPPSPPPPLELKTLATLLERVLAITVSVPKFAIPPPVPAELPESVELLTVKVPPEKIQMPPPLPPPPVELAENVELATVAVLPKRQMPPPSPPPKTEL